MSTVLSVEYDCCGAVYEYPLPAHAPEDVVTKMTEVIDQQHDRECEAEHA